MRMSQPLCVFFRLKTVCDWSHFFFKQNQTSWSYFAHLCEDWNPHLPACGFNFADWVVPFYWAQNGLNLWSAACGYILLLYCTHLVLSGCDEKMPCNRQILSYLYDKESNNVRYYFIFFLLVFLYSLPALRWGSTPGNVTPDCQSTPDMLRTNLCGATHFHSVICKSYLTFTF